MQRTDRLQSRSDPAAAPDFVLTLRVYYEDTDASGVVYHANYLRYFERARTEWLRSLGFDQERLRAEQGVAFTIASLSVRYHLPARLDDELLVSLVLASHGRASMEFEQQIRQARNPEILLASASVRAGCVDMATFRPRVIPPAILKEMDDVD
jgi:acyl-CoA thioester hydrolase